MTDQYFTPKNIASSILLGLTSNYVKYVADFAVGDGSLLNALPFKPKKVIGLDLDHNVISDLKKERPDWELIIGDFLKPSESVEEILKCYHKKLDLILLNPPFSNKGGSYKIVKYNGSLVKCRVALAFVINSLAYLATNGVLIAILPLSILKSETDIKSLKLLETEWSLEFGDRLDKNSFPGCSPNSIILTLSKLKRTKYKQKTQTIQKLDKEAYIIRGATPMYKTLENGLFPVLHSTNINSGRLMLNNFRFFNEKRRSITGKFLCIPRVGAPSKKNIKIIDSTTEYIVSDCLFVIILKDESIISLEMIQTLIINDLENFKGLYDSTCAPYVTQKQLESYFFHKNIRLITIVDRKDIESKEVFTSRDACSAVSS